MKPTFIKFVISSSLYFTLTDARKNESTAFRIKRLESRMTEVEENTFKCSGAITPDDWKDSPDGIYAYVDLASCGFSTTPIVLTSFSGNSNIESKVLGTSSLTALSNQGFTIMFECLEFVNGGELFDASFAKTEKFTVRWIAKRHDLTDDETAAVEAQKQADIEAQADFKLHFQAESADAAAEAQKNAELQESNRSAMEEVKAVAMEMITATEKMEQNRSLIESWFDINMEDLKLLKEQLEAVVDEATEALDFCCAV